MTVASFVVACLAVLISGGALWYARGQKIAAERAAEASSQSAVAAVGQKLAADRAAEAAERAAEAAKQSADAAVGQKIAAERAAEAAAAAESRQQAVDERGRVAWALDQVDQFTLVITNVGTESAHDVRLHATGPVRLTGAHPIAQFPAGHSEAVHLGPKGGFETYLWMIGGHTNYSLAITWHHNSELTDDRRRQVLLSR